MTGYPLDQANTNGKGDGSRLRRGVELEPNVGQMPVRGVWADEQLVRDLALTQAFGDQAEDFAA
jgi:hypothetical protein